MNKLSHIFMRWRCWKHCYDTDVQKCCNTIRLDEDHWCLQRYIFESTVDPSKIPEEKVIKTLIYGVKPSGNMAERGLRETAR